MQNVKPEGAEDGAEVAMALRGDYPSGPGYRTEWEPSFAELALLMQGGRVSVTVFGTEQPAMELNVRVPVAALAPDALIERMARAIHEAGSPPVRWDETCDGLRDLARLRAMASLRVFEETVVPTLTD